MDSIIIVAIIGALSTILSALITAKYKDQQSLNNNVEKISDRGTKLDKEKIGIEIVNPAEYGLVGNWFEVSGTYKFLPENYKIWLTTFEVDNQGDITSYWFQGRATASNGKWYGNINYLGGEDGEQRGFLVIVGGSNTQILFQYYEKVGKELDKWLPIQELTTDAIVCSKGVVILETI
jgi:hypothetical protein